MSACTRLYQRRGLSSWHAAYSSAASGQTADGGAAEPGSSGEAGVRGGSSGEAAGSGGEEEVTPMTAEETVARLEELEELLGHEQHHVSL